MHADALCHHDRAILDSLGDLHRPFSRAGGAGMAPWEYTIAKLLSDAGYATALYGKWHLGEHSGRLPAIRVLTNGGASGTAWTRRATPRGRYSRRVACRCR